MQKNLIIHTTYTLLLHFNYAATLYAPCLDELDKRQKQIVQNSCLCLIYGIQKYQHISDKLKYIPWLNMKDCRFLHMAWFYHKIINHEVPPYLLKKKSLEPMAQYADVLWHSANILKFPLNPTTQTFILC